MAYYGNYQQPGYLGYPAQANPNLIMPQAQTQPQVQQQQQASGALIPVPDEDFARNYPVAYGQSVSFRDEKQPYIYTKTMGFSQMEPPIFKKYKLVEEPTENSENSPGGNFENEFMTQLKGDISTLAESISSVKESTDETAEQIEKMWDEIDELKKLARSTSKDKKEASKNAK